MNRWFEFGMVRGIIGLVIGAVIALLIHTSAVPAMPINVSTIAQLNSTVFVAGLVVGIIIAVIVTVLFDGFMYWLGNEVLEYFGVRASGWKRAALVGATGSAILTLVFVVPIAVLLPSVVAILPIKIATLGAAITVAAIALIEAGFAAITWLVYTKAGWETPA